jgi:hypothetical protein
MTDLDTWENLVLLTDMYKWHFLMCFWFLHQSCLSQKRA